MSAGPRTLGVFAKKPVPGAVKTRLAAEHADLVLGPATDGGYYLIGCSRPIPGIFAGIAWGGPRVLSDTVARLPESCRLALMPPWYDVDTLTDWLALRGQLAAERRMGLD